MGDAAGYANISIMSAYLHMAVDDDGAGLVWPCSIAGSVTEPPWERPQQLVLKRAEPLTTDLLDVADIDMLTDKARFESSERWLPETRFNVNTYDCARRADGFRWDNGELIPGTEGITPGPRVLPQEAGRLPAGGGGDR